MKRIKIISKEEKILYPQKQDNIYLESSKNLLNNTSISTLGVWGGEIGKSILNVKNNILEFDKPCIIYNNFNNIKVSSNNINIVCFKSADLKRNGVGWWEKRDKCILQAGYYFLYPPDPTKKGIITILDQKESDISKFSVIEAMSFFSWDHKQVTEFVGKRFYLYDNKYIVIYFSNCPYIFCPIMDKLVVNNLSTLSNKTLFKEYFNSPEDYLAFLLPIIPSHYESNKEVIFTINDINNF